MNPTPSEKNSLKFWIPALLLIITGGLFVYYNLIFNPFPYRNIEAGYFLDTIHIPFDLAQFGPISFPIWVDNFLVFQEFKDFAPIPFITESLFFAGLIWVSTSILLSLVSEFKKLYFLGFGIAWILILTFSNLNGLNIGGLNTNYPLIILLFGTLSVPVFLHISANSLRLEFRFLLNLLSTGITLFLLVKFSTVEQPVIYLAEHLTIPALGMSLAWIFWNGHGVISGIYILLAKAGRNLNLKISVQIFLITLVYLVLLFNILLDLTGLPLPFIPTFNPLFLLVPMGVFGWFTIQVKTESDVDLVASAKVIKTLYVLGFGLSLWLIYKLQLSGNKPAEELIKHLLTYSQIGFSLFFLIYIMSNFLNVMNSGKAIETVLFKPYSLPYYHLRIGGIIAMLVCMAYADGIIGVQVNSLSNHVLGEYYYNTNQKLEASIIYENTWFRYRNNPKAKNATAQLLFELNQPTLAKQHLEESFAEAPQVDNILLLAERLHRENKILESIFYLEEGLKRFPGNPYLINNLALFYITVNRKEKALALFEDGETREEQRSENYLPIQLKLGNLQESTPASETLSGKINELARQNALGNFPEDEFAESFEMQIEDSSNPMLVQAGWRNLFSIKDFNNPDQDLVLLDSLWNDSSMVDYIMALQETGVIRSLGAGRITDAVKNLNGLAFRNPGDAGYFLQLSSSIMAQQMGFKKASRELIAAEQKGFQAFGPHHWSILTLGGFYEKAEQIRIAHGLKIPDYIASPDEETLQYLNLIEIFNESLPITLYQGWKEMKSEDLKTDMAIRLIAYKSHGLDASDLRTLGEFVQKNRGKSADLSQFLENPDFKNKESVEALMRWMGIGDELTGNPYLNPLIWSAVSINQDDLASYEIINTASEFSKDPIIWIKKVNLARKIGLANYATDALVEMQKWIEPKELERLQLANY